MSIFTFHGLGWWGRIGGDIAKQGVCPRVLYLDVIVTLT